MDKEEARCSRGACGATKAVAMEGDARAPILKYGLCKLLARACVVRL